MTLPDSRFYEFGPFRIDAAERLLLWGGRPLPLTPKAYDMLLVLVRHPGQILEKDVLLREVWPQTAVEENNLHQSVSALRKALGQGTGGPQYIETVPRRGYRFVAPVRVDGRAGPLTEVLDGPPVRPAAAANGANRGPDLSSPRVAETTDRPTGRVARLLAAGLVAATLFAAGVYLSRLRPAPIEPPKFLRLTYSGRDSSPAASRDGRMVAFSSDRDGLRRIWLKQMAGGSELALTSGPDDRPRLSPDGGSVLFSREEGGRRSLYRVSAFGGDARRVVENATDGDWSPDGRHIVFLRSPGTGAGTAVGIASADGAHPREVLHLPGGGLDSPRWSPDGRMVAIRQAGTSSGVPDSILLLAPDGTAARSLVPPGPPGRISSFSWVSRDIVYAQSESLASTRAAVSTRVVRLPLDTGAAQTLLWIPERIRSLDMLGPARLLFDVHSTRQNLQERGLTGAPASPSVRWLSQGQSNDRQPTYSPDGEWVVFSSDKTRNLDLWKVSTRTGATQRLTDDPADDWDPALTRDGKTLLWSSNRGGPFEVWIAAADGSGARQLTRDGVDAENPTATPDGRWIVYSSAHPAKAGIWKVRNDGSQAARLVAGNAVWPEVSPDGRFAAYRNAPYDWPNSRLAQVSVRVVRIADGTVLPFEIRIKEGLSAGRLRWWPDGRAIAFVGPDERGVNGIFVQEFIPDRDTTATRRRLGGFEAAAVIESFGISPDGSRLAIATWEDLASLMVADNVTALAND